jgi:hypothetical protein
MGCNCNHSVPGTNCQCSTPIELARQGLKGDTGSQGNPGADGVATLSNVFGYTPVVGIYNGTLATYSFDPTINMDEDGDKIKIIAVLEVNASAIGTVGIYFNGSLLGDLYHFTQGPEKAVKIEIIVNRVSGVAQVVDQTWEEVPSTSGDASIRYCYPYSVLNVSLASAFNITVNAVQTYVSGQVVLRQYSIERMKLTT